MVSYKPSSTRMVNQFQARMPLIYTVTKAHGIMREDLTPQNVINLYLLVIKSWMPRDPGPILHI